MKKLLKSLMLFAAAAMALTSCENEAMNEGIEANDTVTMTFVADAPQSRTSVSIEGDQANFSWSTDDKVGFYYTGTSAVDYKKKGNASAVIAANGTATFSASFEKNDGEESYNIAAFYPSASWDSHATASYFNNVKVKLPASQDLTEGSFDPAADLMISKPFMGVELNSNTTKVLEFARLVAIGKMNLKLDGMVADEIIKEVKLTFANHTLNGDIVLDMEKSTYALGTSTSKTVTLSGELAANADRTAIFFTCLPGEFSGAYTINVTTDKATYVKEATITKALSFTAGDVLGFNATVGNREEFKVETGVVVDVLNRAFTGIAKNSTTYADWTNKIGTSGAVYAGNSAGDKDAIQLRSTNSNRGIVTTVSGGQVSKVVVTWENSTNDSRTLDVYGKTSAYTDAKDLYNTSTRGTKIGSIKKGTSELEISGDYTFIGLRSNSGAMYLSEIKIYWAGGDTRTPQELKFSKDVVSYTLGSTEAFEMPTLTGAQTNVVYTSSNETVAEVDENTGAITVIGPGSTIITAIAEENDTFKEGKSSYTINVSTADLAGTGDGTQEAPYDVTRLQAKIKNGEIPSGNIYVKGIVSEIKSISVSFGNAEYYISADGTKTNQFQVYRGMYIDGAKFTSEDQLIVSDEVVVCGTLGTYNNVYQFTQGTSIVSLKRTKLVMSAITCTNDGVNENSLTFSWAAVANATSYEVSLNGVSKGSVTGTTYTATGLESGTEYLFGVKAVATGYTTSDEKTCFAKTKAGAGDVVVETETATLSFANVAQRTSFSTSQQVWAQNGVTLTNDKASSSSEVANYSNPVRFYQNSKITVVGPGKMTKIVFDCNSPSYATALKTSIGTVSGCSVSISSDKVTVSFSTSVESFVINKLTAQVRMDSLTVTYEK